MDNMLKTFDGAALRFYVEPQKNEFQSSKQGRPIFDTVLMVEVITPGSKDSTPHFECERIFSDESGLPVRRSPYYDKYKQQIDAFQTDSQSGDMRGTPISQWPAIDVATAAACKEARIYTVEGLAALPDSALPVLGPGALSLRERAKAFLEAAKGNAGHEALAAENVQLRADVERLSAAVEALGQSSAGATRSSAAPPPPPPAAPAPPPPPPPAAPPPPPPPAAPDTIKTDPLAAPPPPQQPAPKVVKGAAKPPII